MKTAQEVNIVSKRQSALVQALETKVNDAIVEEARKGSFNYYLNLDSLPDDGYSRAGKAEFVSRYLKGFGYSCSANADNKKMSVNWEINA